MSSALEVLGDARRRMEDASEHARYATAALDEVSPKLADLAHEVTKRADEALDAVRRAHDALAAAG